MLAIDNKTFKNMVLEQATTPLTEVRDLELVDCVLSKKKNIMILLLQRSKVFLRIICLNSRS